jgi:hypothetical protein
MLPKRLIALTLFATLAGLPACILRAQDWQYTNGPFTDTTNSKKVSDVIAFSKPFESRLFAACRANGVFRTDDRGGHWQQCWLIPKDTINTIVARGSIVLIGTYKGLARSVDSGNHFDSLQNVYYRPWIQQIVCDKNNVFYAIAADDRHNDNIGCFRSNDSGSTWTFLTSAPAGLTPETLIVDSSNQLLFVGGYPSTTGQAIEIQIWKSIDSGSSWLKTESPYYLEDGVFYDASPNGDLYVSSIYEGLIRANDSAYDLWDPIGYLNPADRIDIPHHFAFLNSSIFCAAAGEYIYLTNDGGTTWESIAGKYQEFPSCEFAFNGDLFAAADSGVIRLNPSSLEVQGTNGNLSQAIRLSYEYPGKLSLTTETAGSTKLDLFDVTGRQVSSFDFGELPGGQTRISLPVLPSGMYLARCETLLGSQSCKFIIEP